MANKSVLDLPSVGTIASGADTGDYFHAVIGGNSRAVQFGAVVTGDPQASVFDYLSTALQTKISLRTVATTDATEISAGIDAAIAANANGAVYFPPGWYYVNKTFQQQENCVKLYGDSPSQVLILQRTADIDTFKFGPPLSGSYLNNARIEGMNISHAGVIASSTTGAGVRFVQCNGYRLRNVHVNDAPEGLTIEGGQLGSLKTFSVFAASGSAFPSGSYLLAFKQADLGGGSYQTAYTTEVEDFRLSASELRDTCLRLSSGDGIQFANGYLAYGDNSLLKVAFDRDAATIAAVTFVNTYFDCVDTTPTAIAIPDDAFTSSFCYGLHIGSGCTIGNAPSYGVLCQKPETMLLSVSDTRFLDLGLGAFVVDNASGDLLDVRITGNQFQDCGSASTNVISLTNGRCFSVDGNTFADNVNLVLSLAGTWRTGAVTNNVNAQNLADIGDSATYTQPLVISGNASRFATAGANSWRGARVGNLAVTNANTLDWYEEGTFTPTIAFGGAAVGATYTRQLGYYTRIGNRVFFNLRLTLSAKGSSTGAATVPGLPFGTGDANLSGFPCSLRLNAMATSVGPDMQTADVVAGSTPPSARLFRISSGTQTALTDANFTDTSDVILSGAYLAA